MDIIFATNNPHKLTEIRAAVKDKFNIISLKEAGIFTDIPEDHYTLEENACQKSEFIYKKTGINCFADDTGLEVFTLDNRPGVFSARYANLDGSTHTPEDTSKANILKLLSELEGKETNERLARFRTVISLILNGENHLFEGIAEGRILTDPKGEKGFGYDPIFQPKGYNISFAQMSLEEKNMISHRAIAVKKLLDFLLSL